MHVQYLFRLFVLVEVELDYKNNVFVSDWANYEMYLISNDDIVVPKTGHRDPLDMSVEKDIIKRGAAKYECAKCYKSYNWKPHLIEHLRSACGAAKNKCCLYCSYRTNRQWNLKSHMKRKHKIID